MAQMKRDRIARALARPQQISDAVFGIALTASMLLLAAGGGIFLHIVRVGLGP